MAFYRISDLCNTFEKARKDGLEYVHISIGEPFDGMPETLELEYMDPMLGSEESIDSVELPSELS